MKERGIIYIYVKAWLYIFNGSLGSAVDERMRNNLKVREVLGLYIFVSRSFRFIDTVEPRFNEVAGDRPNLFVKSRVRYIENLDITNLRGNDQNVLYNEVIVND